MESGVSFLEKYMDAALEQAQIALQLKEVPVGAVIVKDNRIIARAHNLKETLKDPTAHAELLAIKEASAFLGNWRLKGCDMYVTLEPCPMCAGAIAQSRISNLYIGTFEPESGGCGSAISIVQNDHLKYRVNVVWTYDNRCSEILSEFFKVRRKNQ
jgi:tRNA(adenine34) deaminase